MVAWLTPLANDGYLGAELLVAEILDESGRIDEATRRHQRAARSGYPGALSVLARLSASQAVADKAPWPGRPKS